MTQVQFSASADGGDIAMAAMGSYKNACGDLFNFDIRHTVPKCPIP